MKRNLFTLLIAGSLLGIAGNSPLNAAVIVEELGHGPSISASISGPNFNVTTPAGMLNLRVNGVAMNGFCIDPFHPGVPYSSDYQFISLPDGPKGVAMGANDALWISRLWGTYYRPDMSNETAAGMQIAIWRLTGIGFNVSGDDHGASIMLQIVQDSGYSGPVADLIGLTGSGQDYVVGKVPDTGSTLGFMTLAFCGLLAVAMKTRG